VDIILPLWDVHILFRLWVLTCYECVWVEKFEYPLSCGVVQQPAAVHRP
jgi:hypothetical protein